MPKVPKKLGIFTERGWLIVLAVAVGLVLGMADLPLHSFLISADISSGRNRSAAAAGLVTSNVVAAGLVTTARR